MSLLAFADFTPGRTFALGEIAVSPEELVAFAQKYDPQPFHVDAVAAAAGPFGGLVASGWHTCALTMRLLVDGLLSRTLGMGSPGIDALRFLHPVRPGDTLTALVTVLAARPSERKPDRGLVTLRIETRNQAGVAVLSMEAMTIVGMA